MAEKGGANGDGDLGFMVMEVFSVDMSNYKTYRFDLEKKSYLFVRG